MNAFAPLPDCHRRFDRTQLLTENLFIISTLIIIIIIVADEWNQRLLFVASVQMIICPLSASPHREYHRSVPRRPDKTLPVLFRN